MLVYLDTSAVAKWYLNESRSEEFSTWIQNQDDTHISSLTVLELRCLLARRQRRDEIPADQERRIFAAFQADIRAGHLIHHTVEDSHVMHAIRLLDRVAPTALRTLDAIHLCIANAIGSAALATADETMAKAAQQLDMHVFDFAP